MYSVAKLWNCQNETEWKGALEQYWKYVKPTNEMLEREIDKLVPSGIQKLDAQGWYDFLSNKYFRWKYTAPNRYATTTKQLKRYIETNTLDQLYQIKNRLFSFDQRNILEGLTITCSSTGGIKGLGTAGASGLLAVLFPRSFGTVDQFVVKALSNIDTLKEISLIRRMKPESLTIPDGVILINIMRAKAEENNRVFVTDFWTPRKIDMILWTCAR